MPVSFTVVIPTHNRRERLLQAITSVRGQSRPASQIVVVADGCTDGTAEAVRGLGDPSIELLEFDKAPRKGWGLRNDAIAIASGDVVAYLGDDDLYLPDHLERIGALYDSGRYELVQVNSIVVWPDGRLAPMGLDWGVPDLRRRFEAAELNRNPMASASHRRDLAVRAGGWDPDPPGEEAGDAHFLRRMLALEPTTVFISEPTVMIVNERFGSRAAVARELLDQMATPIGLAEIRARSGTEGNRIYDHFERLAEELAADRDLRLEAGRIGVAWDALRGRR